MALYVEKRNCPQNHPCPVISICPADAISQNGYGLPIIDKDKCTECGRCLRYCPTGHVRQLNIEWT